MVPGKIMIDSQDKVGLVPWKVLMGARNIRASLSPLHAEVEALLWAMECMRNLRQFRVMFATNCSQLVKMVSEPEE